MNNNNLNKSVKRAKNNLYITKKHLFGAYHVRVELSIQSHLPITGTYKVFIVQSSESSTGEETLWKLIGLTDKFNQNDIDVPDFQYLSLQHNLRAITHLSDNDNYWKSLKTIYYTVLDTYNCMIDDAKKENKYLL